MKNVPLELRRNILDYVCRDSPRNALLQLRTTCKDFKACVSGYAFYTLRFTSSMNDIARLQSLVTLAKEVAALVHDLEIEIVDADDDADTEEEEDYESSRMKRLSSGLERHSESYVFTRLPYKFPSLKAIRLTYSDEIPTEDDFPLFSSDYVYKQLYTLEAIVREAHLTSLTTLAIINLIALPADFQRSGSFSYSLSKLTKLEVLFSAAIPGSHDSAAMSYNALFPKEDGQKRYCGNSEVPWSITDLTLASEEEQSNLVPLDMSTLQFPNLSSLTLRGVSFRLMEGLPLIVADQYIDEMVFILRHAATLRTLVLVDCMTLTDNWSVIWERFANELTQLVNLSVQYTMGTETNYSVYGIEHGDRISEVEFMEEEPETVEQDREAFERLVQIVDERRSRELV